MKTKINRRSFVFAGAAAGLAAVTPRTQFAQTPAVVTRRFAKPLVVASAGGHRAKNGGPVTCVEKAFAMITSDSDVLDALVAGVNIVELDPEDTGAGYGGLPNADGVVQLDAACMHGPKKRAGAVAALEGVRTPSLVAKAVMEQTDHLLLVGKGAQDFARNMGFKVEDDLNTDRSRKLWLEWKRHIDPQHYPDPAKRGAIGYQKGLEMVREGLIDPEHFFGTVSCSGINAKGEICSVSTTSGLAWKIPGRVSDIAIVGTGIYVAGDVGAVGSTGRGEANLHNLSSFLIIELMRGGRHPKDAAVEALQRVKTGTVEPRLLNSRGLPNFGLNFYILSSKGEYAGVSMYEGAQFAICTENGAQTFSCESLLTGRPTD